MDTGFTGFLMLPLSLAGGFRFPMLEPVSVELGDRRETELPGCEVTVEWHRKSRRVRALLANRTQVLIGMKLLRSSLVTLELVSGGSVTVEPAG